MATSDHPNPAIPTKHNHLNPKNHNQSDHLNPKLYGKNDHSNLELYGKSDPLNPELYGKSDHLKWRNELAAVGFIGLTQWKCIVFDVLTHFKIKAHG